MCGVCKGKRYLLVERSSGAQAIERCDACQREKLSDMDAAVLAQADGIKCDASAYPCFVIAD